MTNNMQVALQRHPLPWRVKAGTGHAILDAKGALVFMAAAMDPTAVVWCACVCRLVNEVLQNQDDNK